MHLLPTALPLPTTSACAGDLEIAGKVIFEHPGAHELVMESRADLGLRQQAAQYAPCACNKKQGSGSILDMSGSDTHTHTARWHTIFQTHQLAGSLSRAHLLRPLPPHAPQHEASSSAPHRTTAKRGLCAELASK